MAKFCGNIGFIFDNANRETFPGSGIWVPDIEVRKYYGDVIKNSRRWENGEGLNDNLVIGNQFSVVADAYAYDHLFAMRYIEWLGTKWKITNIDIDRPRITITVGGVYNEA